MKIKCAFCEHELDRKCIVKKTTVKPNKNRKCNDYAFDTKRELERLESSVRMADNRDKAREAKAAPYENPDVLSRFRSNAVG